MQFVTYEDYSTSLKSCYPFRVHACARTKRENFGRGSLTPPNYPLDHGYSFNHIGLHSLLSEFNDAVVCRGQHAVSYLSDMQR